MDTLLAVSETKLKEYRDLFEMVPVGLYRTSIKDGTFLQANPFCANMLGHNTVEELKNNEKSSNFYKSQEDRQAFIQAIKDNDGTIKNYELELVLGSGEHIWVAITGKLNEEKGYLEGSLMDITAKKELEIKLINLKSKEIEYLKTISESAKDITNKIMNGEHYQ